MGVVSGLLGIGGGVLMVPFIYFLMAGAEWSGLAVGSQYEAQFAHATSLALIVPAALSGLVAYAKKGVVSGSLILTLGSAAGGAAFLGAQLAVLLPSVLLKGAFGVFLLAMAWNLASAKRAEASSERPGRRRGRMRWHAALAGGGMVGLMSVLLGVGGGIVAIPILLHWARMDLHRVVAASLGIITFAALAGTVGYAVAGRGVEGLPPLSVGFVHLPLFLAMLPGAVLLAPVGAAWNQRLPTSVLQRMFAVLLFVVGVRLVWLNGSELLSLAGG